VGKLAQLASVKNTRLESFVYTPPPQAYGAIRTLVCLNLGYKVGASPALNWGTVAGVLRGLRRVTPKGRILLVDTICPSSGADALFTKLGIREAIDEETRIATTDDLILVPYTNPMTQAITHQAINAPAYLDEFDCVINVTTFEATPKETKGAITHLYHWLPCDSPIKPTEGDTRHHDIYHTLGRYVDGVVVEYTLGQSINVAWGENALAVDEGVCTLTKTPLPNHLKALKDTYAL